MNDKHLILQILRNQTIEKRKKKIKKLKRKLSKLQDNLHKDLPLNCY
jgi:DNA-binding transcriptional regulator GbsR (MarR family)